MSREAVIRTGLRFSLLVIGVTWTVGDLWRLHSHRLDIVCACCSPGQDFLVLRGYVADNAPFTLAIERLGPTAISLAMLRSGVGNSKWSDLQPNKTAPERDLGCEETEEETPEIYQIFTTVSKLDARHRKARSRQENSHSSSSFHSTPIRGTVPGR